MSSNQKLNPELSLMLRNAAPVAFSQQKQPASFSRTIEEILQERKLYPKELADLLNVDRRTIYKMLQDDECMPSRQMVIAICVALRLAPQESFALLEKAGHRLRMTSAQDTAYFSIISTCGTYRLEDINAVLNAMGIAELGARQK